MKNIGSELGGLLKKICLWGGVMATVCWAFTLLWGFDITQLAGFALGWGYMCLCMYYLGVTCEKAVELEGKKGRFGHDKEADDLGVEIMEAINAFNNAHVNPYCEATGGHFLLHAQVGIAQDKNITPGTRIPIGEEPKELIDQLRHCSRFHKYFPSGTGDIFPVDVTVHKNPQFVLDIVKGAFQADLRYLSFYESDGDVIRVTGYLAKRSEIEKYQKGESVLQNTTQLATGATENGHVQERRIR